MTSLHQHETLAAIAQDIRHQLGGPPITTMAECAKGDKCATKTPARGGRICAQCLWAYWREAGGTLEQLERATGLRLEVVEGRLARRRKA